MDSRPRLPPVDTILSERRVSANTYVLQSDHFNSQMFYGRSSFECTESMESPPSTSNSDCRVPLRSVNVPNGGIPHLHQLQQQQSVSRSQPVQHQEVRHPLNLLKQSSSSPALLHSVRKRRSDLQKLETSQKASVPCELDRAIYGDNKVLRRLRAVELEYLPKEPKKLLALQPEFDANFRSAAVAWLDDVCAESHTEPVVLPLAVSFMDRVFSQIAVPKQSVQAVAAACLLLAGKVKAPAPLQLYQIADFSDGGVTHESLTKWELVVISTLGWQLYSPTAFEFLDQLTTRYAVLQRMLPAFRRIYYNCLKNLEFAVLKPSEQALYTLGYACFEIRNGQLRRAVKTMAKRLFDMPGRKFDDGVKLVAKLQNQNEDATQDGNSSSPIPSAVLVVADSVQTCSDEASPSKIRRTESCRPVAEPSPATTPETTNRRHSSILTVIDSPQIALQAKSLSFCSITSSRHSTCPLEDSGFVSSPETYRKPEKSTPTSSGAPRRIKVARKSTFGSERFSNCFMR